MLGFSRHFGEVRSVTALSFLLGGLALASCVSAAADDVFKSGPCTRGGEGCGCRNDKTCDGTLACLSDLCVNATGSGGTSADGSGGSIAGSAGTTSQGEGGSGSHATSGTSGTSGEAGAGGNGGGTGDGDGGTGGGEAGGNLVQNGDFGDGLALWGFEPAQATYSIDEGALCLTLAAGESVSLGWPTDTARAFVLAGGQSYTFSYRASSSGPLEVSVTSKIGHAVPPYTTQFEEPVALGSSLESYSHDFDVEDADDGAGLVFSIAGAQGGGASTVCFDDVSVLESP